MSNAPPPSGTLLLHRRQVLQSHEPITEPIRSGITEHEREDFVDQALAGIDVVADNLQAKALGRFVELPLQWWTRG